MVQPAGSQKNLRRIVSDEENEAMKIEENRLRSFGLGWQHVGSLSGERMAAAGFYYQGPDDSVTCPFCRLFIEHWDLNDNPLEEHHKHCTTGCPFLQQRGLTAAAHNSHTHPPAGVDPQMDAYMPRQSSFQPTEREMEDRTDRLASFGGWPADNRKQPYELYPAGFYYTGEGDKVRCFDCGGCVEGWNHIDNAWSEHARLFPNCDYVRINKGEFYIDQVLNRPNVVTLKDKLRTFATQRGFTKFEIDQVLGEIYKDEEEMRQAVLNMTEHDYQKLNQQAE